MQAKTGYNGAPTPQPASIAGEGSAGIVSEHDQKYVRSTCLQCWQKVVIAWKKGDYLKDKECPLCGGRLLGKVPVKKGDPDYPVLYANAARATDFHCVALTGTNPFEFVSSAHELVGP
jgi:DNA-directed RNA polymerase subunit RPC12/RpoP